MSKALIAALLLLLPPHAALASKDDAQILLTPFEAAVAGGESGYFSLFVETHSQDDLWDVCYMEPRIRNAVHSWLDRNPMRRDAKGRLDLGPLGGAIGALVQEAVGKPLVSRLHLVEGEWGTDHEPVGVKPPVPNHRDCKRIEFRAKRIK